MLVGLGLRASGFADTLGPGFLLSFRSDAWSLVRRWQSSSADPGVSRALDALDGGGGVAPTRGMDHWRTTGAHPHG